MWLCFLLLVFCCPRCVGLVLLGVLCVVWCGGSPLCSTVGRSGRRISAACTRAPRPSAGGCRSTSRSPRPRAAARRRAPSRRWSDTPCTRSSSAHRRHWSATWREACRGEFYVIRTGLTRAALFGELAAPPPSVATRRGKVAVVVVARAVVGRARAVGKHAAVVGGRARAAGEHGEGEPRRCHGREVEKSDPGARGGSACTVVFIRFGKPAHSSPLPR